MATTTEQQSETRRYFDANAETWTRRAGGAGGAKVNIIAQRNGAVLDTMARMGDVRRLLDIGSGAGELCIEAARGGVEAVGVDFAPDMVRLAETNARTAGTTGARFEAGSIFGFAAAAGSFDVVSAQGLIEYISIDELGRLAELVRGWLRPGGAFVVGSRNRLYNALSQNAFVALERGLGTLDDLLREGAAIGQAPDPDTALAAAEAAARILPQPDSHPGTGVEVRVRHQFTPGELVRRLRPHGFAPAALYGVHYHGLPPSVVAEWPALHVELADAVYRERRRDHRLLPQSTSFVLDLRRI